LTETPALLLLTRPRFVCSSLIFLWALSTGGLASLQALGQAVAGKPVSMATYSDPAGEVSFEYPVVWKIEVVPQFYIDPYIVLSGIKPLASVVFSAEGSGYEKTTLAGLTFTFAKAAKGSALACSTMAAGATTQKTSTVVINAVSFQHFETKDAAMCHEAYQHIYWTYRGGTCWVFEGDMNTIAPESLRAIATLLLLRRRQCCGT
jgi:hypothetical protein